MRGGAGESAREEFRDRLASLPGQNVLTSSESLTYCVADQRCDALLDLVRAARTTMPVKCIWTLRNAVDLTLSLYHRLILARPGAVPTPAEITLRLLRDDSWPENLFIGLRRLEGAVDGVFYLKYRRDGSHNRELLRIVGVPEALAASMEAQLEEQSRLHARFSHKEAVAVLHHEEISARAGVKIDKGDLIDLFFGADFRFDDDAPCNLFGEEEMGELRQRALGAAQRCGFEPYLEFFEGEELPPSAPLKLDPNVLSDEDLERVLDSLADRSSCRRARPPESPVRPEGA